MVSVHHGWLFFPNHAGLISGIILGGFGFGSLIFDNVSTAVINPENKPVNKDTGWYPKEVNERFTKMMYVLMISWALCTLIGILMVFTGPAKKK